ncbi:MAG: hypothetical protein LUQ19_04180 [Methanoregula sp.]|nr:hypothetical protein [Methanoregula sp.]
MHDLLKKLLGKKEPEVVSIPFGSIPAWLNGQEKTARAALESDTDPLKTTIRQATAELQKIVESIKRAEQDPAIHPKLKSIAKNSVPLYTRAMHTSLARELPEESEEFYSAAAECLKSCLNSTHGQGRYLQMVFPEEMKAIRLKIDTIGREVNQITTSLAEFRKEKTLIDAARSVHSALEEIDADLRKAADKDQRIAARIREMTERESAIDRELSALASDARVAEVTGLESALREKETERDSAVRTYAALSMTASHVLRKAEKIATKQKHSAEIAVLRKTIGLLSDHEIPEVNKLRESLGASCPVAKRMIDAGEILLKNKEERAVFSSTLSFGDDICAGCAVLKEKEHACHTLQENLALHPLLQKKNSLEREKSQLGTMLIKEELAKTELEEWRTRTRERVPELSEELHKKIGIILGEGVQLQIGDQRQV